MAGASESEIADAENRLAVQFPAPLRAMLAAENGSESWYGDVFLMMYDVEALVAVNAEIEGHPGLLIFATDGSRELIGFDLREPTPPVVMVDITSAGWHEGLVQARSFDEFMTQRQLAEPLRWDHPYEGA